VSCDLDGETVILGLADGVYYGLDPVGTRVWKHLQSRSTIVAIRDAILEEFDVESEICERDLIALVQEMQEHNLVRVETPSQ